MKMKVHIAAGILAAALLAGGCGKFVRDELITMQNEIDLLEKQVTKMNEGLGTLQGLVRLMAAKGFITDVEEFEDEIGGGSILHFRTVTLDDNGVVTSDDESVFIKLYSGVDGRDGKDADPYIVSMRQDVDDEDETLMRWYWYSTEEDDWIRDEEGKRIPVDGKTPNLKIVEGYWFISWDGKAEDDPDKVWKETGWKAQGDDAFEWFSDAQVLEDRLVLTLTEGSVLELPILLPVDVALTIDGQNPEENVLIAPGETISVHYVLSGTGAENAILVAGTDGRLKTALRVESATEGTVDVTCPEVFPEGGYVYITVNDRNGRSEVRVIRFAGRTFKLLYGDAVYDATAAGEDGRTLTFETNFELDAAAVFPEGVEPWLTVKMETVEGIPVLTYDIAANTGTEARKGDIVVCPKDHPGFEVFRVTVNQAAAEAEPAEPGV